MNRIYKTAITPPGSETVTRIISAPTPEAALRFALSAASTNAVVRAATAMDVAEHFSTGGTIERVADSARDTF